MSSGWVQQGGAYSSCIAEGDPDRTRRPSCISGRFGKLNGVRRQHFRTHLITVAYQSTDRRCSPLTNLNVVTRGPKEWCIHEPLKRVCSGEELLARVQNLYAGLSNLNLSADTLEGVQALARVCVCHIQVVQIRALPVSQRPLCRPAQKA